MFRKNVLLAVAAGAMAMAGSTAHAAHWGYQGEVGPAHWDELSPEFERCGDGRNQSPINLEGMVDSLLDPIAFNYSTRARALVNNGHTVQANVASGSAISVDGRTYELKQFHFHAPSENHIRGDSFPMEAHFVHADDAGNLAVVAVMFEEGQANEAMARLWQKMPREEGEKAELDGDAAVDPAALLPADWSYYRFNGSLTTPPCSEGVLWLVMKTPVTVSPEQVAAFRRAMGGHDNNRPIQPRNARAVME